MDLNNARDSKPKTIFLLGCCCCFFRLPSLCNHFHDAKNDCEDTDLLFCKHVLKKRSSGITFVISFHSVKQNKVSQWLFISELRPPLAERSSVFVHI